MTTHRDLAVENYQFADQAPTPEWRVTFYFYAAVHAVDCHVFPDSSAPPDYNHDRRLRSVSQYLPRAQLPYRELYALSQKARYQPDTHPLPAAAIDEAKKWASQVLKAAGVKIPPPLPPRASDPTK